MIQRMNDHGCVNNFLSRLTLKITFAMLTFVATQTICKHAIPHCMESC